MDSTRKKKKYEEDFLHCFIRTTSTEVIVWKIKQYFNVHRTVNHFDSPHFFLQRASWCLRVYPKTSSSERDDDYIGFVIVRLSSPVPYHKFNVILKGRCITERSLVLTFDEEHEENGDMEFSQPFLEEGLLEVPDSLTLMCQISLCELSPVNALTQTEILIQETKGIGALCQNFKTLLLNGQDHDVVFKVKDKEFRAHQNILRARFPVLESMLNYDMIEKNNGVIDIPDCDPSAFEQLLFYIYCAKVETLDADNKLPLYYVADKYDLEHLKEECREFIKESFSSSNISDVIQLATNHNDADLLQCATDYFVEHVTVILPTVEWQSFILRNGIQANELIIKAVNKMSAEKP